MFGKHILDLAPTPENRRNSEGCFLTLKDGRLLFVYTRYGAEGYHDGCNADLYGIISEDNGETFGEPFLFSGRDRIGADNVMSVTLRRMDNGDMGLFFLRKIEGTQCNGIFVRSADEGKTWSEPLFFTEPLGYICVNPDRIIRLKSGRWLAVGSIHRAAIGIDIQKHIVRISLSGLLQAKHHKTLCGGIYILIKPYPVENIQRIRCSCSNTSHHGCEYHYKAFHRILF